MNLPNENPQSWDSTITSLPLIVDYPATGIERWLLNRSEVYNSLNLDLLESIYEQIEKLKNRSDIKVVIIQGSGKGYCAGHDIKELYNISDYQAHDMCFRQLVQIVLKFRKMHQIIISGVHGSAVAGGCLLAAASDIIIAEENAKFSTPGIEIGLFCFTPMITLFNSLPEKILLEMLLTGRALSATEAESFGLVNKVVANDTITLNTMSYAKMMADKVPHGLSDGKRSFYQLKNADSNQKIETSIHMMAKHFNDIKTQELVKGFLNKPKTTKV